LNIGVMSTVACSAVGVDDMRWSDWTAWNCGRNLSLVRSCIQHTETQVDAVTFSNLSVVMSVSK